MPKGTREAIQRIVSNLSDTMRRVVRLEARAKNGDSELIRKIDARIRLYGFDKTGNLVGPNGADDFEDGQIQARLKALELFEESSEHKIREITKRMQSLGIHTIKAMWDAIHDTTDIMKSGSSLHGERIERLEQLEAKSGDYFDSALGGTRGDIRRLFGIIEAATKGATLESVLDGLRDKIERQTSIATERDFENAKKHGAMTAAALAAHMALAKVEELEAKAKNSGMVDTSPISFSEFADKVEETILQNINKGAGSDEKSGATTRAAASEQLASISDPKAEPGPRYKETFQPGIPDTPEAPSRRAPHVSDWHGYPLTPNPKASQIHYVGEDFNPNDSAANIPDFADGPAEYREAIQGRLADIHQTIRTLHTSAKGRLRNLEARPEFANLIGPGMDRLGKLEVSIRGCEAAQQDAELMAAQALSTAKDARALAVGANIFASWTACPEFAEGEARARGEPGAASPMAEAVARMGDYMSAAEGGGMPKEIAKDLNAVLGEIRSIMASAELIGVKP